jgi:hypothetical protein
MKHDSINDEIRTEWLEASLTVEAALVTPLFLYLIIAFLYFIQIFTLQEKIQSAITRMGLNLAKTAYVYEDFQGATKALNFDVTVFGSELELGLGDLASSGLDSTVLKLLARKYLDTDRINHTCIVEGFQGLSFINSRILREDEFIDIVVQYKVKLPLQIFFMDELQMLQRVRLRCWTGYDVAATYSMEEEGSEDFVYVTETGTVYHISTACSHIKLSIRAVSGVPDNLRNDNGAKYYPCDLCCKGKVDKWGTFYITLDGTRYHTGRECSGIKRNVRKIKQSEVGSRRPCKRCLKSQK